jgi:TPR repeat protein
MLLKAVLLLIGFTAAVLNAEAEIMPGEVEYQQGVAILSETDPRVVELLRSFHANKNARDSDALMDNLRKKNMHAVQWLTESAALGHPVAQYRLALYYQAYLIPDSEQKVCQLYKSSLQQGFAPAVLRVANACMIYTLGPEFMHLLEKAFDRMSQFSSYYPQPTVYLECGKSMPTDVELQWGSQNDYLAELYKLIASQFGRGAEMPKRIEYLEKALATNGCPAARKKLDIYRSPK